MGGSNYDSRRLEVQLGLQTSTKVSPDADGWTFDGVYIRSEIQIRDTLKYN
jgi:hypothetical protein